MEFTPVAWLQARITQARTNGMTYLRRRSDSPILLPEALLFPEEVFVFSAAADCSISASSRLACSPVRERSRAAYAASFCPRRNSQRGDSDTTRLPSTNKIPGGSETQKILRHAVSLKAKSLAGSPRLATSWTRKLKYMPTTAAVTMPRGSSH